MNKYIIAFFASISCASIYAAPGFLRSVISGSPYNGTSDIWKDTAATVVLTPSDVYNTGNVVPESTTIAYGSFMYMQGGTTYYFRAAYDDYTSVKIDNEFVIVQNQGCTESRGSIRFAESGWHKLDLRVSNNAGPGGNTIGSRYGIQYSTSTDSGWLNFADPGDGSKFQTSDPGSLASYTLQYKTPFNYQVSGSVAAITKMLNPSGECNIPSNIDGFTVTSILSGAFQNCTGITSASIPAAIAVIPENAFNGCTSLASVTLREGLLTISANAFYGCTSLTHVDFPSTLTTLGGSAFYRCSKLDEAVMPDSVTSIGGSAFRECSSLVTAKLPKGYSTTADALFMDCVSLETVTMPAAPNKIENHTFRNCNSLTSVAIPPTVTYVGSYAFYNCYVLPEVELPSRIYTIGEYAFHGCYAVRAIDIPDTVMSIGSWAFAYCKSITSIAIPESITTMNSYLVRGCESLVDVTIPSSVTRMEQSIFEDCVSLKEIHIPETVTYIGPFMFQNCTKLMRVNIPKNITTICNSTFAVCTSLAEIDIPDGVTRIEDNAFNMCPIVEIKLPDSLLFIGYHAFYCCTNLKEITIPAGVQEFGIRKDYDTCPAFNGCTGLQRVTFLGAPPTRVADSWLFNRPWQASRKYGAQWIALSGINSFYGYDMGSVKSVKVISSKIRENDPTIMDVVYRVKSSKSKVKVRVLAFEDGERSFAKVVRPETFVEGTGVYVGDNVTPNEEHTISWRVSSDWQTKLAKVKFEVLAMEGELVPLELMTIPESDQYGKMKISWNAISDNQWFDALLWLYADKDPGLTLNNGQLSGGGLILANGAGLYCNQWYQSGYGYHYDYTVHKYVYPKMGYSVLEGAALDYANKETRLGLAPDRARQYAYKIVP